MLHPHNLYFALVEYRTLRVGEFDVFYLERHKMDF